MGNHCPRACSWHPMRGGGRRQPVCCLPFRIQDPLCQVAGLPHFPVPEMTVGGSGSTCPDPPPRSGVPIRPWGSVWPSDPLSGPPESEVAELPPPLVSERSVAWSGLPIPPSTARSFVCVVKRPVDAAAESRVIRCCLSPVPQP